MNPTPRSRVAVPTLLLAIALSGALGGCGFSDELTRRGFIKTGDQICVDTLIRSGLELEPATSQPAFYGAVGSAYGDAAERFRRLDVHSGDEEIRDRIVARYTSFSRRLEAAAGGSVPEDEVGQVFQEGGEFQDELLAHGFDVCAGGRGRQARS